MNVQELIETARTLVADDKGPAAVPGIVFLSVGQSGELASACLNAVNVRFKSRLLAAQQALYHRARCNSDSLASQGPRSKILWAYWLDKQRSLPDWVRSRAIKAKRRTSLCV